MNVRPDAVRRRTRFVERILRIYSATELIDMRDGTDGLRAIVEAALRHDP